MESMYEAALKFIVQNNLIDHYQDRCFEITEEATEGWGFKDSLSYLFKSNIIKDND
jgi:hypothetical protein